MSLRNIQRKASPVMSISAGNGEPATLRAGDQKSFREALDACIKRRNIEEPNWRMGRVKKAALKAQAHSATSKAAAQAAESVSPTQRQLVHSLIALAGERGLTDEEIQTASDLNPSTERPRRVELVDAGFVMDSGRTRKTSSGRNAVVWVAVEFNQEGAKP